MKKAPVFALIAFIACAGTAYADFFEGKVKSVSESKRRIVINSDSKHRTYKTYYNDQTSWPQAIASPSDLKGKRVFVRRHAGRNEIISIGIIG